MIDAEMYGITPSANIDSRFSAPPENMLNMLRIVPDCWLKNSESLAGSMPGHRNERADAVNDQGAQQKEQAMAEIGGNALRRRAAQPD
jgi:hypothetical protein